MTQCEPKRPGENSPSHRDRSKVNTDSARRETRGRWTLREPECKRRGYSTEEIKGVIAARQRQTRCRPAESVLLHERPKLCEHSPMVVAAR